MTRSAYAGNVVSNVIYEKGCYYSITHKKLIHLC